MVEKGLRDSWVGTACSILCLRGLRIHNMTEEEQARCPVCNLASDKFEVIR